MIAAIVVIVAAAAGVTGYYINARRYAGLPFTDVADALNNRVLKLAAG